MRRGLAAILWLILAWTFALVGLQIPFMTTAQADPADGLVGGGDFCGGKLVVAPINNNNWFAIDIDNAAPPRPTR